MQQSGHIGKIVVEPPPVEEVSAAAAPVFKANRDGTHVIIGGLGGFGMATAAWLVERGARHLVLVGRSGAATPEAKAGVARLERLGATVHAVACDASDPAALGRLLTTINTDMPPLNDWPDLFQFFKRANKMIQVEFFETADPGFSDEAFAVGRVNGW